MDTSPTPYAARLAIDYQEKLDRLTTFLRLLWIIPIGVVLWLLSAASSPRWAR